jgi:cytochrome P450
VIEVPSGGVSFDEDIHENAQEFDALRHYRSRMAKTSELTGTKAAEVVANSQFIGVGKSSLTFGYGRHACPGRFFAVNEIKMIMATALLNYEFKNSGGEVGRYPNVKVGSMVRVPKNYQ